MSLISPVHPCGTMSVRAAACCSKFGISLAYFVVKMRQSAGQCSTACGLGSRVFDQPQIIFLAEREFLERTHFCCGRKWGARNVVAECLFQVMAGRICSRKARHMNSAKRLRSLSVTLFSVVLICLGTANLATSSQASQYSDGRPEAKLRIEAHDRGVVLKHGDGPDQCDILGARDIWVYEAKGTYYMHYDGAGPKGWLACLATSKDLVRWEKKGPVLDFGAKGEMDSASASYGVTHFDGKAWHMFYLGTPNTSPAPDLIPSDRKSVV